MMNSALLESSVWTNVRATYAALEGTIQKGDNPMKKIQLIVSGSGGNLYITDMKDEDDADVEEGNDTPWPMLRTNDNNR